VDRTQATTYLTNEYAELVLDARFNDTQTSVAYSAAIDMSLRQLGISETDLPTADVAQADILKYLALLNYYALKRFQRLLSIRVDVKIGQNTLDASRSQAFNAVSQLLDQAHEELLSLGLDIRGTGFEMGRINLDYNEPGLTGVLAGFDDFFWNF